MATKPSVRGLKKVCSGVVRATGLKVDGTLKKGYKYVNGKPKKVTAKKKIAPKRKTVKKLKTKRAAPKRKRAVKRKK